MRTLPLVLVVQVCGAFGLASFSAFQICRFTLVSGEGVQSFSGVVRQRVAHRDDDWIDSV